MRRRECFVQLTGHFRVPKTLTFKTRLRAIPWNSENKPPGFIFFKDPFDGAYIRRGSSKEGNLRFKIDWVSLIVGSKFTVFALFYFVFEGNFSSTSPRGGLYLEGRVNGGFFALPIWGGLYLVGLIHGGAYFRNFTVPFLWKRVLFAWEWKIFFILMFI